MRWFDASIRNDPRKLEYTLTGPLYAASAVFERRQIEDRTQVSAVAHAKLPFGKKYSASIVADSVTQEKDSVGFSTHRESANGIEKCWTLTAEGLVRTDENGRPFVVSRRLLSMLDAPIVSAADLMFRVDEAWAEESSPAGVYFVAGHRLLALRLESGGPELIDGIITTASLADGPKDPVRRFFELPWNEGRKFQFVWSKSLRSVAAVRAQVPLLGRVEARLSQG